MYLSPCPAGSQGRNSQPMNSQPSSAIEKGFTAQLTKRVTPIPRQCRPTWPRAAKSMRRSIGTIISQTRTATGRLTLATSIAPMTAKRSGMR